MADTAMTCAELAELVTEYLEGELTLADRARFEYHVLICPACRQYLKQMKQTVAALGHVPAEAIPPEVEAKLLERFRDWKRSKA